MQETLPIIKEPFKAKNLFSRHYLLELLPKELHRMRYEEANAKALEEIKKLYKSKGDSVERLNESQLEEDFIRPLLRILGHVYDVQAQIRSPLGTFGKPDYAFFRDDKTKNEIKKKEKDYFRSVIAVGEAKAWDEPLDRSKKVKDEKRPNPSLQIDTYLRVSGVRWGILTNGRLWRIHCKDTSFNLDSYYEVDLVNLIEHGTPQAFTYFYLFFRREAFVPDESGKCFLDDVYGGSVRFARELEEDVKGNVYNALKALAKGFLEHPDNRLSKESLEEIHDNCLVFLYRLLFILYAEAKELLPVDKGFYRYMSLDGLKNDIKDALQSPSDSLLVSSGVYWTRLRDLFKLINEGSEARKVPREELFIPPYNGGLFDPNKHDFLEKYRVGDKYLAEAIDFLARASSRNGKGRVFVDYSTLEIRHLGSIYEGLLEYKLRIAEEEMAAVKEKGREKWYPKKEAEGKNAIDKARAGDVYLVTDKGERKATGSYYTPDYIVKYIVENTLSPLIEERKKKEEWKTNPAGEIFSIKVLDPAMGSGHFLVEATNFLARELLDALGESGQEEGDVQWARREVVRHCIYGVDLNPMAVELAKLSLWLSTVAIDKPLAFLDHRLKCGNSLIGARLVEIGHYPLSKKKIDLKQRTIPAIFIEKLVAKVEEISRISDDTLSDVKKKEVLFKELGESPEFGKIKAIANVRTSLYFGNKIEATERKDDEGIYHDLVWTMKGDDAEWKQRTSRNWFRDAMKVTEEKKFFHWELEFPEVFFEAGREKETPGFDAVVGNPPYGAIFSEADKVYLKSKFESPQTVTDAFAIFIEQSLKLVANEKCSGLIIPSGWLTARMHEPLRSSLLDSCHVNTIIHLPYDVFPDAYIDTIIFVMQRAKQKDIGSYYTNVFRFNLREDAQIIVSNKLSYFKVSNAIWKADKQHRFVTSFDSNVSKIQSKLNDHKIDAGEILDVSRGITPFKEISSSSTNAAKGFFGSIGRYELEGEFKTVQYDNSLAEFKPEKFFKGPRLLIRRIISRQHRIHATFVSDDFVINKSYLPAIQIDLSYSTFYILALINSRLYSKNFIWSSEIAKRDDFPQLDIATVKELLIRRIHFTTPAAERARLVEEAKKLYAAPDFAGILKLVDNCLPKDASGNFIAEKEKSDVVHDVLAFLAEQMLEMNKVKQAEIKGFLSWLEREISVKIDDLSNKTAIKEYYGGTLEKMLEVLKKNGKKISRNLSNREFQDNLKKEFDKSAAKLKPLMEKIEATDELIDKIVYKLYGLTEEEVKVVEGG
jgi:type I restriction-modification system DNA methylase subunit